MSDKPFSGAMGSIAEKLSAGLELSTPEPEPVSEAPPSDETTEETPEEQVEQVPEGEEAEPETPPEEEATPEEEPQAEEEAPPQPQKAAKPPDDWRKESDNEKNDALGRIPPHLREVLRQNPELRNRVMREIAIRKDLGYSFDDLREMRSTIGSLRDAKVVREMADRSLDLDRKFQSEPQEFVKDLRDSDPDAFGKVQNLVVSQFLNDPRVAQEMDRRVQRRILDKTRGVAQRQGNQELLELCARWEEAMFGTAQPEAPEHPEIARLRNELETLKAKTATSSTPDMAGVVDYTQGAVQRVINEEITSRLASRTGLNDWSRKQVEMEVGNNLLRELRTLPSFEIQLRSVMVEAMRANNGSLIDAFLREKVVERLPSFLEASIVDATRQAIADSKGKVAAVGKVRPIASRATAPTTPPAPAAKPARKMTMAERLLSGTGLNLR